MKKLIKKPLALIIFDGLGLCNKIEGNAFKQAKTPIFDRLSKDYPFSQLIAHGESVGLPDEQIGNSEVGHMNLGAGRIVYQPLTRISKAIADGDFFQNKILLN